MDHVSDELQAKNREADKDTVFLHPQEGPGKGESKAVKNGTVLKKCEDLGDSWMVQYEGQMRQVKKYHTIPHHAGGASCSHHGGYPSPSHQAQVSNLKGGPWFYVGDEVETQDKNGNWHPGAIVTTILSQSEIEVNLSNGKVLQYPSHRLRKLQAGGPSFYVDEQVETQDQNGNWHPDAIVTKILSESEIEVKLSNGRVLTYPLHRLRKPQAPVPSASLGNPSEASSPSNPKAYVAQIPQVQYQWHVDLSEPSDAAGTTKPGWQPFHHTVNSQLEKAYENPDQSIWSGAVPIWDRTKCENRTFALEVHLNDMIQRNPRTEVTRPVQRLEKDGQWECLVITYKDGFEQRDWKVFSPDNCGIIETAFQSGLSTCQIYLPQVNERSQLLESWKYEVTLCGARGWQSNPQTKKDRPIRRRPGVPQVLSQVFPNQEVQEGPLFPQLLGWSDEVQRDIRGLPWRAVSGLKKARVCEVPSSSALYEKMQSIWNASSRRNSHSPPQRLTRIEIVHAESMEQAWIGATEGSLDTHPPLSQHVQNNMSQQSAKEGEAKLKAWRLAKEELGEKFKQCLSDPTIVYVWHGAKINSLHQIACTGPRKLRTTDGGFFGAGIYTTLEDWYACIYAIMAMQQKATPGCPVAGPAPEYGVILFAATLGNTYVVTRDNDYPHPDPNVTYCGQPVSKFYSNNPFNGIALMPGVETHYAACRQFAGDVNFQACPEDQAECHEVVLESCSQLCPIGIFYFKP